MHLFNQKHLQKHLHNEHIYHNNKKRPLLLSVWVVSMQLEINAHKTHDNVVFKSIFIVNSCDNLSIFYLFV